MLGDLNEHRIFREIVDRGSIIAAARALGLPRSTVSKKLADLERRLGRALFTRTTRRITLTTAGIALRDHVAAALEMIERGEIVVRAEREAERRVITISAPPVLAQNVLGTVAGDILRRQPGIRIDVLSIIDHDPDVHHQVDIRLSAHPSGRAPLGSIIAGISRRGLYAAPSYLATYPAPRRPADLPTDQLVMRQPSETLIITRGSKRATLICNAPLQCVDHETVRDAAIAGAYIAVLPHFIAAPHLARGTLQQVLTDWRFPDIPIAVSVAKRRRNCSIVAAVVEGLPQALERAGLIHRFDSGSMASEP